MDDGLNPNERPLLTIKEAAALLRISLNTAYRMVDSGALPCVRVGAGRAIRIRREVIATIGQTAT